MVKKLTTCALFSLGIGLGACNTHSDSNGVTNGSQASNNTAATSAATSAATTEVANNSAAPTSEIGQLEAKLATDTGNIGLRNEIGSKYYASGNLAKAAQYFGSVYQKDHKNLLAIANLGNIYYDNQQFDQAVSFYEKALELNPGDINMRCDLATSYSALNNFDKAISILKQNIKTDPNHLNSHYNLSVILKKKGDVKGSEKELETYNSLAGKK